MPQIHYRFDPELSVPEQTAIQLVLTRAFDLGEVLPCRCALLEAWVYPTIKPDFQASFSCACDVMRPLYSSTPDTEEG